MLESPLKENVQNDSHNIVGAPNDPEFKKQWGLIEASIGWLDAKKIIEDEFSINYIPNNRSPIAAIIDLGFKYHEDLDRNLYLYGQNHFQILYDYASQTHTLQVNTGNPAISQHGNSSLGIMGAAMNNNIGIAGTAFGLGKFWAIDTHYIDEDGNHINGMDDREINAAIALIIAEKQKADIVVVNMSFVSPTDKLTEQIGKLKNQDIIVVAAAGNYGVDVSQSPYFPAASAMENVISVADLDRNMQLSNDSNFGGNVNIAAPGMGSWSFSGQQDYSLASGSSAAAPFVSGTILAGVALYNSKKSQNYEYAPISAAQLINLLYATANTHPSLQGKVQNGRYINVYRFMQAIVTCRDEAIRLKGRCSISEKFPSRQ